MNRSHKRTDITSNKRDNQLFRLRALASWLRDHVFVQRFNRSLKACKFHHRVRNLPHPQWSKSLVEAIKKTNDLVQQKNDL